MKKWILYIGCIVGVPYNTKAQEIQITHFEREIDSLIVVNQDMINIVDSIAELDVDFGSRSTWKNMYIITKHPEEEAFLISTTGIGRENRYRGFFTYKSKTFFVSPSMDTIFFKLSGKKAIFKGTETDYPPIPQQLPIWLYKIEEGGIKNFPYKGLNGKSYYRELRRPKP